MAEMKLIGSKITKVLAERKADFKGKLSLKTRINRKSTEKVKGSKDVVEIGYGLEVIYGELGKVVVEGLIYVSSDPKTLKEIIKSSERKDYETKEQMAISNIILQKASIRALSLEEELALPAHIKLPTLSAKED